MATKKQKVTNRLQAVGAAWATSSDRHVSPDDPPGSGRAYHVHPDRSYPHVGAILRFRTLDEINEWCKMREEQAAVMVGAPQEPAPDASDEEWSEYMNDMDMRLSWQAALSYDFWASVS